MVVGFAILVIVNWTVAITLLRLAYRRGPRIRALTERAWLAVLIAVVTTLTFGAQELPGSAALGLASRLMMVSVSLYPVWWLWAYHTNRF
jgi:hypothetical protein